MRQSFCFKRANYGGLRMCAGPSIVLAMHTLPAHLLDELARVYARAAVRAYLANREKCGPPTSAPAQVTEQRLTPDPPVCKSAPRLKPSTRKRRGPAGEGKQEALDLHWR
jgi:hypothetical protein